MSRYRAAAIHLGLSALIFCALAYLVLFVWYPDFLFETDGGWEGMRIIVLVDLVIGPLLTLIVFKAGKPGLKFDLSMIATTQAACMLAGIWIVYEGRPIAVVYVDGHFYSMAARAYRDVGVEPPDLSGYPGPEPKWVAVDLPTDVTEQSDVRSTMWRAGRPLATLVDRYKPFNPTLLEPAEAQTQDELLKSDQSDAISDWLRRHGGDLADYTFYRFGGRYAYEYLGFSRETHDFVGVLPVPVSPLSGSG
jgi:hypothetical protein